MIALRRSLLLGACILSAAASPVKGQPGAPGAPNQPVLERHYEQGGTTGLQLNLMRDPRLGGQRVAVLARDWLYCYPPTQQLELVPRQYVTDFASIPSFARGFIDPFGNNAEAAVAHDWFYAVGEPDKRAEADEVLRYALKEQGVGMFTRNIMFLAVRFFGGRSYGTQREWDTRFGDPDRGAALPHAPYEKRTRAFVGKVSGSCADTMNDPQTLNDLYQRYGSDRWPKSAAYSAQQP